MKHIFAALLLMLVYPVNAQDWRCHVADATTGRPLPYAVISLLPGQSVLYSDSSGNFSLDLNLIAGTDSIRIEYIGFTTLTVSIKNMADAYDFLLTPEGAILPDVTVNACSRYREFTLNRNAGKVIDYAGPGPETKIIILAHYSSKTELEGWLTQIEIYSGNFERAFNVPVRLHWYAWDTVKKTIGEELTSGSIIIYPRNRGWNHFALPQHTVYFPAEGIVFGLEFIYPVEYEKQFGSLLSETEKAGWLKDKTKRWSLGMQLTDDEKDRAWFMINNGTMHTYPPYSDEAFLKPALRFVLAACVRK